MTSEQPYIAIGVPILFNAVLALPLRASVRDLEETMTARLTAVGQRFKELWCSEVHSVEEVLDARFKHLDERSRP